MAIEYITIADADAVDRNVAVDFDGTNAYQVVKAAFGADGAFTLVTDAVGLPVNVLNTSIAVTAATLPLPSGAATAANQSTANASLATLAGAVAGTEVQVDVVTMPNVTIAGTVPVSGTFWQATQPVSNAGTFATQAAQSGAWTVQPGNTANTTAWLVTGTGGTFPATQSGTWNVGTVTTVTTVSTVSIVTAVSDAQAQGKAAHDAAVSGNPLLIGVEGRRARATAVSADGDVVRLTADRYGHLRTVGLEHTVAAVDMTSSGATDLVAAPGASTRIRVFRVEASNTHATTALTVSLKSPSLNGGTIFGKKYLPAAGGQATWVFPKGHLMCGVNEALQGNLSGAGTVSYTAYYDLVAD